MKPIGGYFELELKPGPHHYHDAAFPMKSGRSALHHILNFIKPSLVFIPYYTCDALLEPFITANVKYTFYAINEYLEPETLPELNDGEYFLYINYFDIKRGTVAQLSAKYKDQLIVDCTQAFFMKGNNTSWFFNSCRKFFGVPDGSYLYTPARMLFPVIEAKNEGYVMTHLLNRFNGHAREGYSSFLENEILAGNGILGMSKLSEYLLSNIDYEDAMEKRKANYSYVHNRLKGMNLFDASFHVGGVPMCYPLLPTNIINTQTLAADNIFIPSFWKDTHNRNMEGFEIEKKLTTHLLPLPVDQRYSITEMDILCNSLFVS
jgi:hypothetical protein